MPVRRSLTAPVQRVLEVVVQLSAKVCQGHQDNSRHVHGLPFAGFRRKHQPSVFRPRWLFRKKVKCRQPRWRVSCGQGLFVHRCLGKIKSSWSSESDPELLGGVGRHLCDEKRERSSSHACENCSSTSRSPATAALASVNTSSTPCTFGT